MTNPILQQNLIARIDGAIADYKNAGLLDHNLLACP